MPWQMIVKSRRNLRLVPNLDDYEKACADFSWSKARLELDGLPDGKGLNIAHEAVERHAAGPLSNHVAIRWLGKSGETRDYTFAELQHLSNRFANVLQQLSVTKGETVCVLAGRIPELYIAALGTLKNRSIFCPLFSAFGPEPIRSRMAIGQAKVLVTTVPLYERKVAPFRESLPNLKHIILVGDNQKPTSVDGTLDFQGSMDEK
jgi:acetyl-CoA synthetase